MYQKALILYCIPKDNGLEKGQVFQFHIVVLIIDETVFYFI